MNSLLGVFKLAADACGTKTGWLPSLYDNLGCKDGAPQLEYASDIAIIIGNLVRILIAIAGSLAVILLLVSSIYYITAMGDPGRVKKAKDIIVNTCLGLVLVIASYAIVTYLVGAL